MNRILLGLVLALAAAGCSALPEAGPVVSDTSVPRSAAPEPAPFTPLGPGRGDSQTEIVAGFLTAMQANPLSTSVAKRFLTPGARTTWSPERSMIVHQGTAVQETADGVRVRLGNGSRLDARGAWLGPLPAGERHLNFRLVRVNGEWRISDPVDALVVPMEFFESRFRAYNLYFFDPTRQVLVPEKVYQPRASQAASNLVRALVAGPSTHLDSVLWSAFPAGTALDLSVVKADDGVAEIPLDSRVGSLSPRRLERAAAQLQFTLRQVADLSAIRVTIDGEPISMGEAGVDVPLSRPGKWSTQPPGLVDEPYGLREGRIVGLGGGRESATKGPFGRPGFSIRSFGVDLEGRRVLAVATDRATVFSGRLRSGAADGVRRRYQGTDVLAPAFDHSGDGWLVDRTARGARLIRVGRRGTEVVSAPGLTGQHVRAFVVSRDGTRLVALIGRRAGQLVEVPLRRSTSGAFVRAMSGKRIGRPLADVAGRVELVWGGPTDVMLLSRLGRQTSQVRRLSADGSPGDPTLVEPDLLRAQALGLAGSSDPQVPVLVLASDGRLLALRQGGSWRDFGPRPGLRSLTYPG